ncbi:AlwI family type II restriction endonuclease [Clostridium sp. 1001275B_160808_H3]|uniref:AlwI family type II restriction endonuclease n=1 Tax=Clostridium sp. 1001275B_160808_H3 TaxID=2787110 RepID=UPI00189C0352|nr:AlwI family type II restriction endonuclease [Clostridium sp. 1001275B_160808_H3]
MEIKSGSITWNLGDTSFRRKRLLDDYKELLSELLNLNEEFDNNWGKEIQEQYYKKLVRNTELLNDKDCSANRQDKLGRTYTSGLYKIGLCTKQRVISEVGLQFLGKIEFCPDELENKLMIKKENIIFLRQLLKLCIYDENNSKAFNPFIFLIKLINKYDYLTKDEFMLLLHLSNGGTNYDYVIESFVKVRNKEITLAKFLEENITVADDIIVEERNSFINSEEYDEKLFEKVFVNRKTSESVIKYKMFYNALIEYNKSNSNENLKKLITLIKDKAIKKAFSTSKFFNTRKLNKITITQFNHIYGDVKFINNYGKSFREFFLDTFIISKQEDLISEYVDMTFRVFNLTGLINFKNDKITIGRFYAKEYFKYIDNNLNPLIPNNQDEIFSVKTTIQILGSNKTAEVDKIISENLGLKLGEDIDKVIKSKEISDFECFIKERFTRENIINILKDISKRDDKKVFGEVTDQTTIPTIFEYILGIAWYHISDYKFNLYDSLNLTLDSTYYPLTHAAGGEGDIVIEYDNPERHKLMLEATLMDINTQKRGELEPVIRHTTNLTIDNKNNIAYTIFVANELDNNVVNIFRFCDLIKLESSKNKGNFTDRTKIVALTIGEVIELLEKQIKYNKIYNEVINEFNIKDLDLINNNWRYRFTKAIFER